MLAVKLGLFASCSGVKDPRCFSRSLETLTAVVDVFVDAYIQFGLAKYTYRLSNPNKVPPFGFVDFLFAR